MDPLLKYQGEPNDIPIPILSSSSSTYYVGQSLFITVQHQVVEATVRYIGPISRQKPGEWVGLELTQPLGKNDGSYNGQRYFSCAMKHGLFRHIDEVHPPEGEANLGKAKIMVPSSIHNHSTSKVKARSIKLSNNGSMIIVVVAQLLLLSISKR